jgi:hypothetical protein
MVPKGKFCTAIGTLLWFAALGVLAENVVLSRQYRRLLEAVAAAAGLCVAL